MEIQDRTEPLDSRPRIARALEAKRRSGRFTQEQWAKQFGVNRMTIAAMESGVLPVTANTVRAIDNLDIDDASFRLALRTLTQ